MSSTSAASWPSRSASSTSPGHIDFIHTDTAEQFQGQGLAKVLAHFALDDVVASGKRIIPNCPFMYRYLRKHESYNQYIDWPEQVPDGSLSAGPGRPGSARRAPACEPGQQPRKV